MIDADDQGRERTSRVRVRASGRAWLAYWFVLLPVVASFFATLMLVVGLIFGKVIGGGIGALVVPFLLTAGQARPGGRRDTSGGLSLRAAVSCVAVFAAADAATVAIVVATGRLPRWALVLAVVSLVIHLGLGLVMVLRRDRIRQIDDEREQSRIEPERKVRWRETPELLRSLTGLAVAGLAVALGVFAISELADVPVDSPVERWAGSAWGLSTALLGIAIALDLGGSAEFSARRSQTRRGHEGLWAAEGRLPALRRWMRCSGLVMAAAGAVIAWIFWASA